MVFRTFRLLATEVRQLREVVQTVAETMGQPYRDPRFDSLDQRVGALESSLSVRLAEAESILMVAERERKNAQAAEKRAERKAQAIQDELEDGFETGVEGGEFPTLHVPERQAEAVSPVHGAVGGNRRLTRREQAMMFRQANGG